MSSNDVISLKDKKKIKFAFENAVELLKTQKARGERIELSILRGDTPTFMEYPLARKPKDLENADAVILGIPFEGLTIHTPMIMAPPTCGRPPKDSVYWRMGADEGLDMIRKYSIYYSVNHNRGYFPEIDKELIMEDYIKVLDYGDVPYTPEDIEGNLERAEERVSHIVKAGAVPIILGGDHTVPTPTLRAILKPRTKKAGLIVFDAHMDLSYEPKNWASTEWNQVLELGKISPENFVCIGVRGVRNSIFEKNVAQELGHRVITIDEVKDRGIKNIMDEAIKIATDGTDGIYFSLDIDVMDPSQVVSQKAPEFWGLTMDEMFHALRKVSREKIIGCDICEYTSDYDFNGMGAQFCARVVAEFLGGIALRKREQMKGD